MKTVSIDELKVGTKVEWGIGAKKPEVLQVNKVDRVRSLVDLEYADDPGFVPIGLDNKKVSDFIKNDSGKILFNFDMP